MLHLHAVIEFLISSFLGYSWHYLSIRIPKANIVSCFVGLWKCENWYCSCLSCFVCLILLSFYSKTSSQVVLINLYRFVCKKESILFLLLHYFWEVVSCCWNSFCAWRCAEWTRMIMVNNTIIMIVLWWCAQRFWSIFQYGYGIVLPV